LGGFSQGGTLANYVGLTAPFSLAGILALSCVIPIHKTIDWETANKIPILQCHGDLDNVVKPAYAKWSADMLSTHLPRHTFKTYPRLEHALCKEENKDIQNFFNEVIPQL
jgi:lysophospholipase-2